MPRLATPLRAFLIAPLTAPVVYWLAMVASAVVDGRATRLHDAPAALPLVIAIGAPIAYAMTLGFGLPLYIVARRSNAIGVAATTAAGAGVGLGLSLILAPSLRGDLFSIPFPPWLGALAGAATAAVWWRLARGADESRRRPA